MGFCTATCTGITFIGVVRPASEEWPAGVEDRQIEDGSSVLGGREAVQYQHLHVFSLPWFWYFVFRNCCPNRVWGFLFFEPPFEHFLNVVHAKGTDCRARNAEKGEENHEDEDDSGGRAQFPRGTQSLRGVGGTRVLLVPTC